MPATRQIIQRNFALYLKLSDNRFRSECAALPY